MTTDTAAAVETVRVRADRASVRRFGDWTTARRVEVRSHRGTAVLDLRSRLIPEGDLEVHVDLDHSTLRLLVPDGAAIDDWDLRFIGRGKVKDWTGENGDGRRIRLSGEIRVGEIRVHRGGVAILSAMLTREYVQDVRRVHREGGRPIVDDPGRER